MENEIFFFFECTVYRCQRLLSQNENNGWESFVEALDSEHMYVHNILMFKEIYIHILFYDLLSDASGNSNQFD